MKSGVYTITSPSGKIYVGSAVDFSKRWQIHRNRLRRNVHENAKLQACWNKYGDLLQFKKILVCSREHVVMYEQIAIDSLKPELNICKFAGSTLGYKHTEETKSKFHQRKLSRGNLGKSHSEETKKRISSAKKGKPNLLRAGITVPDDLRKRISESLKGRFCGEKHPSFGTKRSDETRKKLSESHKGKSNKSASIPVRCIEENIRFDSSVEAAKWLVSRGVTKAYGPYIASASRGVFKSAYGYTWERV